MDQLVAAVAAATGVPAELVLRSAGARAKADGAEVEAVLQAWSGGGALAAATAPPVAPAAAEAAPAVEAAPAPEAVVPDGPAVEIVKGPEPDPELEPAAVPQPSEPDWEPEEEAAAAGAIPRWLVALFVIVPTLVVMYALFLPNGPNCGDSGRLAVDPVTGEAVNCDGSPYGVEVINFFTIGQDEYSGCAACHGENGAGAGNFPAFVGGALLSTFPEGQCDAMIEWVRVGTAGWPDATYGATAKPVGGSGAVMPAFGGVLDDRQLRSVIVYERVQFGGQDLEAAITDCGLADEEDAATEE